MILVPAAGFHRSVDVTFLSLARFARVGPFAVDTIVERMDLAFVIDGAFIVQFSAAWVGSGDETQANFSSGTPVLGQTDVSFFGIPGMQFFPSAGRFFTQTFWPGRRILSGPRFVMLFVSHGTNMAFLDLSVSFKVLQEQREMEALPVAG